MTNIVTAVLLSVITNASIPRQIGSHSAGRVMETQHQIQKNWQLSVNGESLGVMPVVVTNWVTLEIEPTNQLSGLISNVVAASTNAASAKETAPERALRTRREREAERQGVIKSR